MAENSYAILGENIEGKLEQREELNMGPLKYALIIYSPLPSSAEPL